MYALLNARSAVRFLTAFVFPFSACSYSPERYLFSDATLCVSSSSCACCALMISASRLTAFIISKSFSPAEIFACSCAWSCNKSFFDVTAPCIPYFFSCSIFPLMHCCSNLCIFLNSSGNSIFFHSMSIGCT